MRRTVTQNQQVDREISTTHIVILSRCPEPTSHARDALGAPSGVTAKCTRSLWTYSNSHPATWCARFLRCYLPLQKHP